MRLPLCGFIVALAWLGGCCCQKQCQAPDKRHLANGGRFLKALITSDSSYAATELGTTGGLPGLELPLKKETLALPGAWAELVIQHDHAGALRDSKLLVGPNSTGPLWRAEFDCDELLGPVRIQSGMGYIIGNWRLARGRCVRATGVSPFGNPPAKRLNLCSSLSSAYDVDPGLMFVAADNRDRVYALGPTHGVWLQPEANGQPGNLVQLPAGYYCEFDAETGELLVNPTKIEATKDDDYKRAMELAAFRHW